MTRRPFTRGERRVINVAAYVVAVGATLTGLAVVGMAGIDFVTWALICVACIWAWSQILHCKRKP